MSDLRARIAAIAEAHMYNEWAETDAEVCSCGESESFVWPTHFADVLIRELGLPPTWGTPSFENGRADD